MRCIKNWIASLNRILHVFMINSIGRCIYTYQLHKLQRVTVQSIVRKPTLTAFENLFWKTQFYGLRLKFIEHTKV